MEHFTSLNCNLMQRDICRFDKIGIAVRAKSIVWEMLRLFSKRTLVRLSEFLCGYWIIFTVVSLTGRRRMLSGVHVVSVTSWMVPRVPWLTCIEQWVCLLVCVSGPHACKSRVTSFYLMDLQSECWVGAMVCMVTTYCSTQYCIPMMHTLDIYRHQVS